MSDLAQTTACEFDSVLRHWLTLDEYAAAVAENATEPNPLVCHTHDYLDANEAMVEAMERALGRRPRIRSEADTNLFNRAWDLWRSCCTPYGWHPPSQESPL
jgi:hypothetical protein